MQQLVVSFSWDMYNKEKNKLISTAKKESFSFD